MTEIPHTGPANYFEATEEIERLQDTLDKIQSWCLAYPLDIFPEPDFSKCHRLLDAGGQRLDNVSASNMRHVLKGIQEIIDGD